MKNYLEKLIAGMSTMKKASMEASSIDCLVLGCENGRLVCVDAEAFTVLSECQLPSPPAFIHSSGLSNRRDLFYCLEIN